MLSHIGCIIKYVYGVCVSVYPRAVVSLLAVACLVFCDCVVVV